MPGGFKLDHLQPFKPILFWKIFNFFPFILGSQFLIPQSANNGSWENFPFPIWMRMRGLVPGAFKLEYRGKELSTVHPACNVLLNTNWLGQFLVEQCGPSFWSDVRCDVILLERSIFGKKNCGHYNQNALSL